MQQFDVKLRLRSTNIDVVVRNLTVRHDIRVEGELILDPGTIRVSLAKFINPDDHSLILTSYIGAWVLKTTFARFENETILTSKLSEVLATKIMSNLDNEMILVPGTTNLATTKFIYGLSDVLELGESNINTELESFTSIEDELILVPELGTVLSEKFEKGEFEAELSSKLEINLDTNINPDELEMILESSCHASLVHVKDLLEIDKDEYGAYLYLADWDDVYLDSMDYLVLD